MPVDLKMTCLLCYALRLVEMQVDERTHEYHLPAMGCGCPREKGVVTLHYAISYTYVRPVRVVDAVLEVT